MSTPWRIALYIIIIIIIETLSDINDILPCGAFDASAVAMILLARDRANCPPGNERNVFV